MFSALGSGKQLKLPIAGLNDRMTGAGKGRSVCLVSDSRAEHEPTPDRLARLLAADGWNVTLLDLSHFAVDQEAGDAKSQTPFRRVRLLGKYKETAWFTPIQSLSAYHWLSDAAQNFDLILFHQGFGAAYFSCVARQLGLAFAKTPLVVLVDAPFARWKEEQMHLPTAPRTELETDFLERQVVARTDGVLCFDETCFAWMAASDWSLPAKAGQCAALQGKGGGIAWGEWLAEHIAAAQKPVKAKIADIRITVCLTAKNGASYMDELIESLLSQTVADFDVVIVDHSKGNKTLAAHRKKWDATFKKRGWQWESLPGADFGVAQKKAAALARGTHLFFTTDEHTAQPDAIALLEQSAKSGADILACLAVVDPRCGAIWSIAHVRSRPGSLWPNFALPWIPIGPSLPLALFFDVVQDNNFLIKREVFDVLTARCQSGLVPFSLELQLRGVAAGQRLEIMPEVIVASRLSKPPALSKQAAFDKTLFLTELVSQASQPVLAPLLLGLRAQYVNNKIKVLERFPPVQNQDNTAVLRSGAFFETPKQKGNIIVVCCFDDIYIRHAGVMLASLFATAISPITVYAIAELTPENHAVVDKVLGMFSQQHKHEIIFVPPHIVATKNVAQADIDGLQTNINFHRLFLPEYLPKLKRLIYMDCDLIIRKPVNELWEADLGDNIMGGVTEIDLFNHPIYLATNGRDYFNGGVLLLDMDRWRQIDMTGKAIKAIEDYHANPQRFQLWDQSPLNKAVAGKYLHLAPTWNMGIGMQPHFAGHYGLSENALHHMKADPHIFHFMGHMKPWLEDYALATPFAYEYHTYAKIIDGIMATVKAKKKSA